MSVKNIKKNKPKKNTSKKKQVGGDFIVDRGDLEKIHTYLLNLLSKGIIKSETSIIESYKRFLTIIHPDKGGNTEMFQILGSPQTEHTFLYYLKTLEINNEEEVALLIGHNNFTFGDIISLTDKMNPKYESFKRMLESTVNENIREVSDDVVNYQKEYIIEEIMTFFALYTLTNLEDDSINIDVYISLLRFYRDILKKGTEIATNASQKQLCELLLPSIDNRLTDMQEYNDHLATIQTGGGDETNLCPDVFTQDEWVAWLKSKTKKREAALDTDATDDLYADLREALLTNQQNYSAGRLYPEKQELAEIEKSIKEKFGNVNSSKLVVALRDISAIMSNTPRAKNMGWGIFTRLLLAILVKFQIFDTGVSELFYGKAFILVINGLLLFKAIISYAQEYVKKNKNDIINSAMWGTTLMLLIIYLLSSLGYLFINQENVAWFAYASKFTTPEEMQRIYDSHNLAIVTSVKGEVLPSYANVGLAVKSLNASPNFTEETLEMMIDDIKDPKIFRMGNVALSEKQVTTKFWNTVIAPVTGFIKKSLNSERAYIEGIEYGGNNSSKNKKRKTRKNKKSRKTKKTKKNKKTGKTRKVINSRITGGGVFDDLSAVTGKLSQVTGNVAQATGNVAQTTENIAAAIPGVAANLNGVLISAQRSIATGPGIIGDAIADALKPQLKELLSLISGGTQHPESLLVKILRAPSKFAGILRQYNVNIEGLPPAFKQFGFYEHLLNTRLSPDVIENFTWIGHLTNQIANNLSGKPERFSFAGSGIWYTSVATIADSLFLAGSQFATEQFFYGALAANTMLLAAPEFFKFVKTKTPKASAYLSYNFTTAPGELLRSQRELDCVREFILFKIYERYLRGENSIITTESVLNQTNKITNALQERSGVRVIVTTKCVENAQNIKSQIFTSIKNAQAALSEDYNGVKKEFRFPASGILTFNLTKKTPSNDSCANNLFEISITKLAAQENAATVDNVDLARVKSIENVEPETQPGTPNQRIFEAQLVPSARALHL